MNSLASYRHYSRVVRSIQHALGVDSESSHDHDSIDPLLATCLGGEMIRIRGRGRTDSSESQSSSHSHEDDDMTKVDLGELSMQGLGFQSTDP